MSDLKENKKRPEINRRNVLITSALPYTNNVPHLGNIIGCVLSADVYARYCRLRGYNTLYICGTDSFGTATETKALQEGTTPEKISEQFHDIHVQIYKWFNIEFDHFSSTRNAKHKEITHEIFNKCLENKFVTEQKTEQIYCLTCKRFLADRYLVGTCPNCKSQDARADQCDTCGDFPDHLLDPKCSVCKGNNLEKKSSDHLFLAPPEIQLLEQLCQQNKETWSANAVAITNAWLKKGLQRRSITRDLYWGTPVPDKPNKVFFVWFDAPLAYLSITADYSPDYWREWWMPTKNAPVSLCQFMGKDNVPFHTLMFPGTLLATQQRWTMVQHLSACEFLNYEKGKKFSKTKKIGVFGDDVQKTQQPVDVWRYYLLSVRPESADTEFSWDAFRWANNNELLANLGNLVNRTLQFVAHQCPQIKVPQFESKHCQTIDFVFQNDICVLSEQFLRYMEGIRLCEGLKIVMKISSAANKYMTMKAPWDKRNKTESKNVCLVLLTSTIALLSILISPFLPETAVMIQHQLVFKEGNSIVLKQPIRNLLDELISKFSGHRLIPERVMPLFSTIYVTQVNDWRTMFG
jgi:methionyl-tRNA synthetase